MFNGRENSCGQDPGAALTLPRTGWSWGETGVLPHLTSHQQCRVGGQAAASVAGWAPLVVTQLALGGACVLLPCWDRPGQEESCWCGWSWRPSPTAGGGVLGNWGGRSRAGLPRTRRPFVNCAEWAHHPHKMWRTGPGLLRTDVSAASESGHHPWRPAEPASGPLPGRRGLGTRG